MTNPDAQVARWQRSLLPGGLVAGADARRSPRDWAIDVLLSVLAGVLGIVLIAIQHYDDARWVLDTALGLASIVALWWRRRYPAAVGAGTTIVSIISAFAGGAALIALFSATLRASRTGLIVVWTLALAAALVAPIVLPAGDA